MPPSDPLPAPRRRRIIVLGAVALIALYAAGALVMVPWIGRDLGGRVIGEVQADGVTRAVFKGQDGTLYCDQPLADPAAVLARAEGVRGVHAITLDASCGDPSVPATTTTVAPTTTEAPTTTAAAQRYVAIGESVMVGAVNQLQTGGFYVDAKENRGPEGVKNAVIKLRDAGVLGDGSTLVIQVGTNAPMGDAEVAAIMAEIPAGVVGVYFMTLHAGVDWIPGNNELIRALPTTYPGVQVIDWDARAGEVQLCSDGIHITCGGSGPALFYTNLILGAVGLPLVS